MLVGRGGRVFCLVDVISCSLAVAKNYSLYRGSKLPMKNATRFLPSSDDPGRQRRETLGTRLVVSQMLFYTLYDVTVLICIF